MRWLSWLLILLLPVVGYDSFVGHPLSMDRTHGTEPSIEAL